MDPSLSGVAGISPDEYGTDPTKGDYNYDFSYYHEDELVVSSDSAGIHDNATEYFAESLRKYYSLDPEDRERYRYLMPETFGYLDQLVNSL